jgi:endoglucanase
MENKIDAFSQNQRLGRGVNVIGYDPLWRSRAEARMQARHFRLIKEAGFDHVRINLHPFKFMEDAPGYAISPAWLETLDWAVAQALDNDLVAILDMHEFNAMGRDFTRLKAKCLAVWEQLAARYQDAPDTVFFELLNEPYGTLTVALWNEFLVEPYDIVRRTNPDRTLVIGPAFWNGIDYIEDLQLPEADRNIIVTVHYYNPMPFTHQGASWSEFRDRSNVAWLGLPEERQAIIRDLSKVQVWAEQQQRPIYLGEFGTYEKADMASRARYTSFMARYAEQLGWSWGYWQFDADFVVYDIKQDAWVTPILNALIPPEGSDECEP